MVINIIIKLYFTINVEKSINFNSISFVNLKFIIQVKYIFGQFIIKFIIIFNLTIIIVNRFNFIHFNLPMI